MEILSEKLNNELEKRMMEREKLENMFEAQQDIFDEIQQIDPRDEIEEKEKEIKKYEEEICKHRDYLESLLNRKPKKSSKNEIIGKIIYQVQKAIFLLERKSLETGSCDIKDILILTDQINQIIEKLIDSNLMKETEEEAQARAKKLDDLGIKILQLYQK